MEEQKKKKQQAVRTDYWLQPNIVVKVVTKRLGEKYHKKKAVVMVTMLADVTSSVQCLFNRTQTWTDQSACFDMIADRCRGCLC